MPPGGCHQRNRHGQVLGLMVGFYADGLEVIVDSSPQGRCPIGDTPMNVWPAMSCGRMELRKSRQSVVARHQDDQRIPFSTA